ncbi:MAG: DinB family protein [Chloroflexi bacterium]|nr:DinB family protein [Chloroflexota bacterium]
MLASVNREEALRLLKVEHAAVSRLINDLTDAEMTRRDTIRYGLYADQECSFKDLLAHLICYEALTLEAIAAWRAGEKHWVIDAVDDVRASRDIHYGGIADRARLSLEEQIDEYRQTSARLESALAEMLDEQWREPAFYPTRGGADLGGMIESIMVTPPRPMYRHLPVHIPDSKAYIRSLRQSRVA